MSETKNLSELTKALDELHDYLSDLVPPLIVADSIAFLMKQAPELTASSIHSWITSQNRSIPVSDFLYHAVIKIHLMREYKLIPSEEVLPFLNKLKPIILEFCPVDDRELLKVNLEQLEKSSGAVSSQVEILFRQKAVKTETLASPEETVKQSEFRRFNQLIKKLERRLNTIGPANDLALRQDQTISEALAEAARSARETVQLNGLLERLRRLGLNGTEDLINALAKNLPGWSLPRPELQLPEDSNLQAMRRIVKEAKDPSETANRFRQLVKAAIERFNEGSLPQAASMIDLAQKIIDAKEVDPSAFDIVRAKADENLNVDRLRKYAESPEQHVQLRKILNFFTALTPQGLLQSLHRELKRDRRRLLLALLESHGEAARAAVIEHLRVPLGQNVAQEEIYFRRNLIYLLRHIPASPNSPVEEVVDVMVHHAELNLPMLLLKETFSYLPQLKHQKVEELLKDSLVETESMLMKPEEAPYEPKEVLVLRDRIVSSLCRLGTPAARKAVIDHALKKKSELGNTLACLAEFSNQDLSDDSETVERLLAALKANLPLKVLGVVLQQRDYNAKIIVEALSGTHLPQVRTMMEELAHRYLNRETGRAAANTLAMPEKEITVGQAPETPAVTLMGDVDLFGLPGLLQSLASSEVSGILTLKRLQGEIFAKIVIEKGKLRTCESGILSSETAFFQLFEKPTSGTFEFARTSPKVGGNESELKEILPLMFEGIRRYDELQQARAIVSDDLRVKARAERPVILREEKDGLLFRNLWQAVQRGTTPIECEASIAVDSYRIRRLLAHWLEQGAIEASN